MARVLGKDQADHAKQAQQTRGGTQHRLGHILSWRFKPQVCTHLLKRGLYGPAGREPTGNLLGAEARVGSVKVLISMRALNIVDEDPPDRHQTSTGLIPMAGTADQLNKAITASIPTDRCCGELTTSYYLLRRRQLAAFDAGSAHPVSLLRR